MMLWTIDARHATSVMEADSFWKALDSLKDEDPSDFGLIVIAMPEDAKDEGDARAVRTSALMFRWRRPDWAMKYVQAAIEQGLPDTSDEDRRVALNSLKEAP